MTADRGDTTERATEANIHDDDHLPLFLTLLKFATLLVSLTFSFLTCWSGFGTRPPPGTVNACCPGSWLQGLLANIASLCNGSDPVLAVSTLQTKQGKMPSSSEAVFLGVAQY